MRFLMATMSTQSLDRVIDGGNADLRKAQPPSHIHHRHYVLMFGVRIRTDRQRQFVVARGNLSQRVANRFVSIIDKFAAVDQVGAGLGDHDIDLLRWLFHDGGAVGFGQSNSDL